MGQIKPGAECRFTSWDELCLINLLGRLTGQFYGLADLSRLVIATEPQIDDQLILFMLPDEPLNIYRTTTLYRSPATPPVDGKRNPVNHEYLAPLNGHGKRVEMYDFWRVIMFIDHSVECFFKLIDTPHFLLLHFACRRRPFGH